jgi:hypothetical protein
MTTYMHCRPYCGTNISIYSTSFHCVGSGGIQTSTYQTYTPTSYHYHDQAPPPMTTTTLASTPRRRRRLEDPIITYASNYYATLPHQMSQGLSQQSLPPPPPPPLSQPPPPLPPPRRIYQQSNHNGVYCDLFNLLERPSPPSPPITKQCRKHHFNDLSPRRHHRPLDFDNVHTKSKNTNERKRHHQQQQSSYHKEKKRQDDKLSSTEQYDRSAVKTKQMNDVYQRRSPNKGFFRRVVRNYFCMPSTFANNGYSS